MYFLNITIFIIALMAFTTLEAQDLEPMEEKAPEMEPIEERAQELESMSKNKLMESTPQPSSPPSNEEIYTEQLESSTESIGFSSEDQTEPMEERAQELEEKEEKTQELEPIEERAQELEEKEEKTQKLESIEERAQELEEKEELQSMESTPEPSLQPFNEEINTEQIESLTESIASSENKTETIAILFEEIDPTADASVQSVVNTTDLNDLITSEYNGFDLNKTESSFSCFGRSFGQYADVDKDCRVFHLCYPFINSTTNELMYQRITFLCDDNSVFDQKRFICVDNSTLEHKCSDSEVLYQSSNQEYLIRVFSQSVSPINEVKGQSGSEGKTNSSQTWYNWLYG